MIVLLFGCVGTSVSSEVVKIDTVLNKVTITWITYDSAFTLQQACVAAGVVVKKGRFIRGCAQPNRREGTCIIHAQIPEHVNDTKTLVLGHEALHCFAGAFHK